jgi:hypothetical protein
MSSHRPNGPIVLQVNCWAVGPKPAYAHSVPLSVALGWENDRPFGALTALVLQAVLGYGGRPWRYFLSLVIAAVYRKAGVPDRFDGRFYDIPHRFSLAMQDDAARFFDRHLKGTSAQAKGNGEEKVPFAASNLADELDAVRDRVILERCLRSRVTP